MRISWSTTLISALILTVCLIAFIPVGVKFALTWREPYIQGGMLREQNYFTILGFSSLGFVTIGLITLWTGYRKKEPWAWLIMLIIVLCFVFPGNVLPPLLIGLQDGTGVQWSYWFEIKWWGDPLGMRFGLGVLNFVVMLIALCLPIKTFWFGRVKSRALDQCHNNGNDPIIE